MNLRGIVSVSGKPGLWKALAQNKTGFILESLDAQKIKLIANLSTAKIAALDEITIFGDGEDIKLTDVFERMKSIKNVPEAKADGSKLRELFKEVAPGHDQEKVYASDMKKIVSWYYILKDMPLFSEAAPADVPDESATPAEEVKTVKESKLAKGAKPANAKNSTTKEQAPPPQKPRAKKK